MANQIQTDFQLSEYDQILTGSEFADLRSKLGKSQSQLAELFNIKVGSIKHQEGKKDEPVTKDYSDALLSFKAHLNSGALAGQPDTDDDDFQAHEIPEKPLSNIDDDDNELKVAYEDTYLASLADSFDDELLTDLIPNTPSNENQGENEMPIAPKTNSFERSYLMEELKSKNNRIINLETQYNQLLSKSSVDINEKNNKISELNIKLNGLDNKVEYLEEKISLKDEKIRKLNKKIEELQPQVEAGLSDKASKEFLSEVIKNPTFNSLGGALVNRLLSTQPPQQQQSQQQQGNDPTDLSNISDEEISGDL